MDDLLINYRYCVGQISNNYQNQAQLFSSHSDLITLMSSVNKSITSQEALLCQKNNEVIIKKNKEIIKSIRNC